MRQPNALKRDVSTTWKRLENWFKHHLPEAMSALNRGASESAIFRFEEQVGVTLPPDVHQSFLIHDGERSETVCVGCIFGLSLLSLDNAFSIWQTWNDISPNPETDRNTKSIPAGWVQPRYFHPAWIPLTDDDGGNHIAVDLAPDEHGILGQIIVFGRDDLKHFVLAPNFSVFLENIFAELANGNFVIDRRDEQTVVTRVPIVEFKPMEPSVDHFHIALADKRFRNASRQTESESD